MDHVGHTCLHAQLSPHAAPQHEVLMAGETVRQSGLEQISSNLTVHPNRLGILLTCVSQCRDTGREPESLLLGPAPR